MILKLMYNGLIVSLHVQLKKYYNIFQPS